MKNKIIRTGIILFLGITLIISLIGCSNEGNSPQPTTRIITDMYGTQMTIPAKIDRVLSAGPVETQLIYMLAPEKLCALYGTVSGIGSWTSTTSAWSSGWKGDSPYIPEKYLDQALNGPIPDVGNGSNNTLSFEAAIATDPDIILEGKTKNLENYRAHFGNIPVVGVNAGDSLCWDFKNEIKFIGDLLEVPEKANELIAYYEEAMNYVNSVVKDIRPANITDTDNPQQIRVYYAQGTNGMQTDARGSWHTNLLWFCGGANVADVQVQNTSQAVNVSMEQILSWEDKDTIDMIIIGRSSQDMTYKAIMNDPSWQSVDCVKKGAVYVRPDNPASWFDGPPGYGQIVGMYWMTNLLYPNQTGNLDLNAKIKEFYSKFLHYDLSDTELANLLSQPATQ